MKSNSLHKRAKKRKPITSANDIQWEVVYGSSVAESEEAINEALEIVTLFGCREGYLGTDILDEEQEQKMTEEKSAQTKVADSSLVVFA